MAGATCELPGHGGLDPSVGVDLTYFVNDEGFSRPMTAPGQRPAAVVDGADAPAGRAAAATEQLYGVTSVKGLSQEVARRLDRYNDEKDLFEPVQDIPLDAPLCPAGHPFRFTDAGVEYYYFPARSRTSA